MARLSSRTRRKMSPRSFALPGRRFPINDRKHARLAIRGATRAYNAGDISRAEEHQVKARARRKLRRGAGRRSSRR